MMIMNIKRGSWLREKTIARKMVVNKNQQGWNATIARNDEHKDN